MVPNVYTSLRLPLRLPLNTLATTYVYADTRRGGNSCCGLLSVWYLDDALDTSVGSSSYFEYLLFMLSSYLLECVNLAGSHNTPKILLIIILVIIILLLLSTWISNWAAFVASCGTSYVLSLRFPVSSFQLPQ